MIRRRHLALLAGAILVTVPGILVRLTGVELAPPVQAVVAGAGIFGAAFLLLWACDAAQADVSQAIALAVVALVAVLPEYAVDMYFTWQAGQHPQSDYANFAIANMTGANRLLIGVAWVVIVAIFWVKTRKAVQLDGDRRTELFFLGLATVYALVIPIKGSLAWYDGVVLLGIYAWYIVLAARRPCTECEIEGPAELLMGLSTRGRRLATGGLFLYAAAAVLANAEPFSEGLIRTGEQFGINQFLLVQWLAPIASEAPEFIVAIMFALRLKAGLALGSLLSAKLNQWTLLVGMIPLVYAVSHGSLDHPIPMGDFQMREILLTAAQSVLAVVLLASLRLTMGQGLLLFGLFVGQLVAPTLVAQLPGATLFGVASSQMHLLFSAFYFIAALTLVLDDPSRLRTVWEGRSVQRSPVLA